MLAKRVGTTQSVISQLEHADYEGNPLAMLNRIAGVVGLRIEIGLIPKKRASQPIRRREQRELGKLFGTVQFLPGFDHKKLRAKRYKLKKILAKGSGVPAEQLDWAYDPKSLAVFRVAEDRVSCGKRRSRGGKARA
jgi:transcriptional regulator with XRE-family HTH domain